MSALRAALAPIIDHAIAPFVPHAIERRGTTAADGKRFT